MSDDDLYRHLSRGFEALKNICGTPPTCSAAPGWKANETMLFQKELFPFRYNSDCRGTSAFVPVVDGQRLTQPQIPVTLPTYDEIIGQNGITNGTFNDHVLSIVCRDLFDDFLSQAAQRGIEVVPCGSLVDTGMELPSDTIVPHVQPGREGWIAFQQSSS
jgi:undecaprenyl phosphate-alpha-L-ara4FN deformylase